MAIIFILHKTQDYYSLTALTLPQAYLHTYPNTNSHYSPYQTYCQTYQTYYIHYIYPSCLNQTDHISHTILIANHFSNPNIILHLISHMYTISCPYHRIYDPFSLSDILNFMNYYFLSYYR
jgi:hypothetical protein